MPRPTHFQWKISWDLKDKHYFQLTVKLNKNILAHQVGHFSARRRLPITLKRCSVSAVRSSSAPGWSYSAMSRLVAVRLFFRPSPRPVDAGRSFTTSAQRFGQRLAKILHAIHYYCKSVAYVTYFIRSKRWNPFKCDLAKPVGWAAQWKLTTFLAIKFVLADVLNVSCTTSLATN